MAREYFSYISGFDTRAVPAKRRAPLALTVAAAEASAGLDPEASIDEIRSHLRNIVTMIADLRDVGVPVATAAAWIEVSEPTVRSWAKRGVLDAVADSSPMLITSASLARALSAVTEVRRLGENRQMLERVIYTLQDRDTIRNLNEEFQQLRDGRTVDVNDEYLDEVFG